MTIILLFPYCLSCHYPDPGSASYWLKQIFACCMTNQTSFRGETSGSIVEWRLFSHDN